MVDRLPGWDVLGTPDGDPVTVSFGPIGRAPELVRLAALPPVHALPAGAATAPVWPAPAGPGAPSAPDVPQATGISALSVLAGIDADPGPAAAVRTDSAPGPDDRFAIAPAAVFVGTPGNDFYSGTPDADDIRGLEGNDTLMGADGDDTIDGGEGKDTANFAEAVEGVHDRSVRRWSWRSLGSAKGCTIKPWDQTPSLSAPRSARCWIFRQAREPVGMPRSARGRDRRDGLAPDSWDLPRITS
jgi:hypothetical protein